MLEVLVFFGYVDNKRFHLVTKIVEQEKVGKLKLKLHNTTQSMKNQKQRCYLNEFPISMTCLLPAKMQKRKLSIGFPSISIESPALYVAIIEDGTCVDRSCGNRYCGPSSA